jgi:hypothetical protein
MMMMKAAISKEANEETAIYGPKSIFKNSIRSTQMGTFLKGAAHSPSLTSNQPKEDADDFREN